MYQPAACFTLCSVARLIPTFKDNWCTPEMKVKEGGGSKADPYEIGTLCQRQDISSRPTAYYELVDNINASKTKDWNNGEDFDPIEHNVSGGFSGSFVNASNYVINSLMISRISMDNVGLFSELATGAMIRGIMLAGSRTIGHDQVGSLLVSATEV